MNYFRFASLLIARNITNNISILLFFTLFIFMASSFIFTASSLRSSLDQAIKKEPDIILQKRVASRAHPTPVEIIDTLLEIPGISKIYERVYGYYHFNYASKMINIAGINLFDEYWTQELQKLKSDFNLKEFLQKDQMLVSSSVFKLFRQYNYTEYFNFLTMDGTKRIYLYDSFDKKANLFLNDTVLLDIALAKEILGYSDEEATDIALIVPNKLEIETIVQKLLVLFPQYQITTQEDIYEQSHDLYDYGGGMFLSLFLCSFLAFLVIFYTQMSGNVHSGKKRIGILRSLGWSINDIIKWKMSESLIISLISFVSGLFLSYLYIFFIPNNLFVKIFLGSENLYNDVTLDFVFDAQSFAILFLVTVIPFIASTLHPSWKAAITDPTEAMR